MTVNFQVMLRYLPFVKYCDFGLLSSNVKVAMLRHWPFLVNL
jgi:hypothetical protein